jgi:hypothetical protein
MGMNLQSERRLPNSVTRIVGDPKVERVTVLLEEGLAEGIDHTNRNGQ